MEILLSKIFEKVVNEKKGFKILAWIFIILIVLAIIFYPIIDANFLYYNRTNKRIEIIQKLTNIDENDIKKDERMEKEYNSILEDMNNQRTNYMNNIFQKETNKGKNIAKFLANSWIFILVGIIMPFTKDKINGRRFSKNNILGSIACFFIAGILGYIGFKIPNIINFAVNIILYQIIIIYLAYTISTAGNKQKTYKIG